jgi:hypothetical protein
MPGLIEVMVDGEIILIDVMVDCEIILTSYLKDSLSF